MKTNPSKVYTRKVFTNAGESGAFFGKAYGYALFPAIGKGGVGIGGAYGKGRVYAGGKHIGNTNHKSGADAPPNLPTSGR